MNQHYFDVPFAFSGDKTSIPDPLQVGGTVSFTEGWNYNYQRNLSTDPAALPIDRSTTNWLFMQITQALQALQQAGVPEFITAANNGGSTFSYGKGSVVLWSASGNAPFTKYVNLTAGNTATPSASDPQGLTSGWQVVVDPISTAAQAGTGTDDASIMTPLKVASQVALRALLAGSSSQVFNVGPATSLTHAPEASQVQANAFCYGVAGGTANALTVTLSPAPTALTDGMIICVRTVAANTQGVTLAVNGIAAVTVETLAQQALIGGEFVANGFAVFAYSSAQSKFILLESSGGFSSQAPLMGEAMGVKAQVTAVSTSVAYTAKQIIVRNPTTGATQLLTSFAKTLNVSGTGAGGMDTGAAPTSGYVAVYAGWGQTPGAVIFGQNATSSAASEQYTGANIPAGVTMTQLIGVLPTNSSGQFPILTQFNRHVDIGLTTVLSNSTVVSVITALSISAVVPPNAISVDGNMTSQSSAGGNAQISLYADSVGTGVKQNFANITGANGVAEPFTALHLGTAQNLYYTTGYAGSGTPTFVVTIAGYEF